MRYEGAVFRPPSEAYSLIVQVTYGCSHNKCGFCYMYKGKPFGIRPMKEVMEDLAWARRQYSRVDRIFLADGDALILPMESLMQILTYIEDNFPECERVAVYASPKSIIGKTPEELRILHEHGIKIAYMGLESGNDELLEIYTKGHTSAEIIGAGLKMKDAGIALSVTAINGLGGKERTEQHAIDTAKAISAMKPDYVGLLTLRVFSNTPLYNWVNEGKITLMQPRELALENRLLLEHIDSEGTVFRSNHASNYVILKGTLNRDREMLIKTIDDAIENEKFRKKVELGF